MGAEMADADGVAVRRGERAARVTPIVPPAPVTFSTTTVWPSAARIRSLRARASASVGPPAANGTMMVIGFDG